MSKLHHTGFITLIPALPHELIEVTEGTIGRRVTPQERRVFGELYETTIGAYDMRESEPNAVQVKKWLEWIARHGQLPVHVATPDVHLANRLRVISNMRERPAAEVLDEVFATPMAGECELLAAKEYVEAALQSIQPQQRTPEKIRHAARQAIRTVSGVIRKGRPSRHSDFGIYWAWADLAEHIGIHPGASFKPAKGKHHSPFLTWLRAVAFHMPERTRKAFTKNLGQHVEEALQVRRKHGVDSKLFE